ncbi:hypothetical protein [Elizabethkingia occulta]|uniref:hypothetical protein n=2 Tax=Elizabethkingia occulta TaxID=1867263 RepID=UPI00398C6B4E
MNLHSLNVSIRSTVKGSTLLILNSFIFITAAILSFIISYKSIYIPLGIAFSLSSIIEALFFLQNSKSIKAWNWYLYYTLSIAIIITISYPYTHENYTTSILGLISLCQGFLLLSLATDLRNHDSVHWAIPARSSGLAILFSIILIAHSVFDLIPTSFIIGGVFIMIALSYILLVSEFKKLNKHYKSIKILSRELK